MEKAGKKFQISQKEERKDIWWRALLPWGHAEALHAPRYGEAGQLQWQETKEILPSETWRAGRSMRPGQSSVTLPKPNHFCQTFHFLWGSKFLGKNISPTLLWPKKVWLCLRVLGEHPPSRGAVLDLLRGSSACCSCSVRPWGMSRSPLPAGKLGSAGYSGLCFTQLNIKHVLNRSTWVILLTWTWADEQHVVKKKQQITFVPVWSHLVVRGYCYLYE